MEGHRALRLNLLTTNQRNRRLRTATYDVFNIFSLLAFKRKPKNMLHDMLIHIIKALRAIILLILRTYASFPVRIPSVRHSQAQIASPGNRHRRIISYLTYRISNIIRSKHIPMHLNIICCQQRAIKHATRGTQTQQLVLDFFFETIKKTYIHF